MYNNFLTSKKCKCSNYSWTEGVLFSCRDYLNCSMEQGHTILVFEAFSGLTNRSQNSRINSILSVISIPPSPSPEINIILMKTANLILVKEKQSRKQGINDLVQIGALQLEIQFPATHISSLDI